MDSSYPPGTKTSPEALSRRSALADTGCYTQHRIIGQNLKAWDKQEVSRAVLVAFSGSQLYK